MKTTTLERSGDYARLAHDAIHARYGFTQHARQRAMRHLTDRLGRLKGLPQKLGQMLSFSGDPDSVAGPLGELYEAAEPLSLQAVEPILEAEWGRSLHEVVRRISPRGLAASLGQVHQATLRDGRKVAIKVQYPGIDQAIASDLRSLGWLGLPLGMGKGGLDLRAYQQVIGNELKQELDYLAEAARQRRFADWAAGEAELVVPAVIPELTTSKVLVSAWESGDTWDAVLRNWDRSQQELMGEVIFRLFHAGLFQQGMVHADLHPGNVRFRRNAAGVQLLLYDFGSVFQAHEGEHLILLRLLRATLQEDESPYPLFLRLGFRDEYLQPLAARLPALCKAMFQPYLHPGRYHLTDWHLAERFQDILGDDRWNFRLAGPPALVYLMRAFHGMFYYVRGLRARVPCHEILQSHLRRLGPALDAIELPPSPGVARDFSSMAQYLKIRIVENGFTKVQVTHRAAVIDRMESLLDDSLQQQIARQGICLKALVAQVRSTGYQPQQLFQLQEQSRTICVWLE